LWNKKLDIYPEEKGIVWEVSVARQNVYSNRLLASLIHDGTGFCLGVKIQSISFGPRGQVRTKEERATVEGAMESAAAAAGSKQLSRKLLIDIMERVCR
jgi:hypothetical protein